MDIDFLVQKHQERLEEGILSRQFDGLNKLMEEVGELAEVINKDLGNECLERELADVIHTCCIIAVRAKTKNLGRILENVFNLKSIKHGSKVYIRGDENLHS